MSNERPTTESGREAVRLRGLFGGETEERASLWVRKIEVEAMEVQRDLRRMADLIEAEAHERSAGAAPLHTDAIEWLDILWRHLDERDKDAIRPGYQKIIERLAERTDR